MILARQIPPEHQQSYLDLHDDDIFDHMNICGNRDYVPRVSVLFEDVRRIVDEDFVDSFEECVKHNNFAETNILKDYIIYLPEWCGNYEAQKIYKVLLDDDGESVEDRDSVICKVLQIITREEWSHGTIRGCCQSEWQKIYYATSYWDDNDIHNLEVEYFNTGTEWMIGFGDDDVEPEDIHEHSMYCHGYTYDSIKKEIADFYSSTPDSVKLFAFTGYKKTPEYKVITDKV